MKIRVQLDAEFCGATEGDNVAFLYALQTFFESWGLPYNPRLRFLTEKEVPESEES